MKFFIDLPQIETKTSTVFLLIQILAKNIEKNGKGFHSLFTFKRG